MMFSVCTQITNSQNSNVYRIAHPPHVGSSWTHIYSNSANFKLSVKYTASAAVVSYR